MLFARLPFAIARADVVHLTGAYSASTLPTFAVCKFLGKPLVWSPRGALQATQDWDHAPRRAAKQAFEVMLNACRPRDMVMHVTAQSEAEQSVQRFRGVATKIIPNAVAIPAHLPRHISDPTRCRLMSMGRLHPKKGLEVLFDAMEQLPKHITLDIYGVGAPAYEKELHARAKVLGSRVRFHGHLHDDDKAAAFAMSDLFVLPSYSENFGIVVAEALAHGVPVLTTTATPWQALDRLDCGRCVPLSQIRLTTEIAALADGADLQAMGAKGRAWVARDFAASAMVDSFADLYRSIAPAKFQEVTA
jgi:glycosyltransferase involved in cell wall biosynthesis